VSLARDLRPPSATGNVATEDILYALRGSPYRTAGRAEDRLDALAAVGWWASGLLGRETTSRVGKAIWARKERERRAAEKAAAKL
jgi:hydroxymethylglutaryl-CoA lyase